ncbi:MAG: hypothetical protein JJU02_00205 [Cryomorphaceae bacterium]|nr:hypothetical protein [Cryomorphaceae bacterium]
MRNLYSLVSLLVSLTLCGQHKGMWTEHLSFNNLVDVAQVGNLIFGATSQGIMIYDKSDGSVERLTKQNGLSDVEIVALAVHEPTNRLVIGYQNGNIDLYRNGRITNISDISRSTLYLGNRRLNHIRVINNNLYVSMAFGIVVVNLSENLVRETYIIGPAGSQLEVFQVDIDPVGGFVYAGTPDGLYRASLQSPLIFFQSWSRVSRFGQAEIPFVTVFKDRPFVLRTDPNASDSVLYLQDSVWVHFDGFVPQNYSELRASNDLLIGAHDFGLRAFNENLGSIYNLTQDNLRRDNFIPNKVIRDKDGERLWIASMQTGLNEISPERYFLTYLPEGPPANNAFSLFHNGEKLYVSTAALSSTATEQFDRSGVYTYSNFSWDQISGDQLNNINDIVAVASHPDNPNHLFFASWGGGLQEFKDGQLINTFNTSNLSEHALTPVSNTSSSNIRVAAMDWDSKGNLWIVTSQNDNPLAVRRADGTWEQFSLGSTVNTTTIVQKMMVTSIDQIWVQTRSSGIVVAQENESGGMDIRHLNQSEGSGELPSNAVNDFDEDRNGAIWIGTGAGVGVIFNPRNIFISGQNYDAVRITFEEDGVVQALLASENVTKVLVDGANKKWFGTSFRGAFYTSSDGREEIFAFNRSTSPLPSNNILDIAVDPESGEVFFATSGGVTSFQGAATEGKDEFEEPFAYPNPVRPDYSGPIFIRNLVTDAQVKITDVYGNLVFETRAEGGQAVWDGRGFHGEPVASGVYQAMMNDREGFQTAVVKILIVR